VKSAPVPADKTPPQPAETGKKKTYNLIIEAQELTWVRIMEDQNPAFQGLLNPGDRIERAADLFQIDLGNAGGVQLTFQGKPLGSPGKRGQVLHMRLPEGGAEVKSP
jgi:cytoskeleton protein RodZ